MRITAFGHICFLAELEPRRGAAPFRLLADPWLSDVAVGDLMGRFPRVRFSGRDLGPLDAIWLSHAHTDHLDPASLVRLWGELESRPPILLPQSLRFLGSLIGEYLEEAELIFLEDRRPVEFGAISVEAFFNPEKRATNEDDVMILVVSSDEERLVSESDAVFPFWDPDERASMGALLAGERKTTTVYITAKNELEATMSSLAARHLVDRRGRKDSSLQKIYEELEELYEAGEWSPRDEDDRRLIEEVFGGEIEDEGDLALAPEPFSNPSLVRLIGGQGMCYPQALGTEWNHVLFPVKVEDRVRIEREVAERCGFEHGIEELVPGKVHVIEDGILVRRKPCAFIQLLDREEERRFDSALDLFDDSPVAPLRDEERDRAEQHAKILDYLNGRFLPWFIGARRPPFEHVLAESDGEYRIRVRFGTTRSSGDVDYRVGFDHPRFERVAAEGSPREHYWANDLDDILEGHADEFSTFPRRPIGAPEQTLLRTMGLPYLNADLVERKLRFHFERAARGDDPVEWVLGFYPERPKG